MSKQNNRSKQKKEERTVGQQVNLGALPVVLELARELDIGEAVEDLADTLCRLRKHRVDGDAWAEVALLRKSVDPRREQRGDDATEVGHLAEDLLQSDFRVDEALLQLRAAEGP